MKPTRYNHQPDGSSCMREEDSGLYILYDAYLEELAALRKEVRGLQWLVTMINDKKEYDTGE